MIHCLAEWCESQDRALYQYFEIKERVENTNYVASETEMIVMENYLGNYMEVRLSQCFILEVDKPIMELIDFCESRKVRIHLIYQSMVSLVTTWLSKFVSGTVMPVACGDAMDLAKKLLKVKYREKENQLDNEQIWLGKRVEALLTELGLTRKSQVLKYWLEHNVRRFYVTAMDRIVKYFSTSLKSELMEALCS